MGNGIHGTTEYGPRPAAGGPIDAVLLTGEQTITGRKTFSAGLAVTAGGADLSNTHISLPAGGILNTTGDSVIRAHQDLHLGGYLGVSGNNLSLGNGTSTARGFWSFQNKLTLPEIDSLGPLVISSAGGTTANGVWTFPSGGMAFQQNGSGVLTGWSGLLNDQSSGIIASGKSVALMGVDGFAFLLADSGTGITLGYESPLPLTINSSLFNLNAAEIHGLAPKAKVISGSTYVTVAEDDWRELVFTNASGCTVTLSALPSGAQIFFRHDATAGTVNFVSGTLTRQQANGLFNLTGRYNMASAKIDGTTAVLFGGGLS